MSYSVAYIKNSEEFAHDNFIDGATIEFAYDNFIDGATISDIVEELTYNANRYGVDYDEIAIFDSDDAEVATVYYSVVNDDGNYKLVELV